MRFSSLASRRLVHKGPIWSRCGATGDDGQGVVTSYAYVLPSATAVKMRSRGQGPSDAVVKGSKAFSMDGQIIDNRTT